MKWLNYHHLLYFWMVAREGSVTRAGTKLHLAQPTISGQLRAFEKSLGTRLFEKRGRNLVMTDTGQMVFRYAEEIFHLGREMQEAVAGRATGRPRRFTVGIVDVMPKLIVHRLLEPALRLADPLQLVCLEGEPDQLLAQLALHELDLVLSDAPASQTVRLKAFNHLLGECGISFFAVHELAAQLRPHFPRSLDGAPFLLPIAKTSLRRSLDQWFEKEKIRPHLRGEIADSALLKTFGGIGIGVFPAPAAVEKEIREQFRVEVVGRLEEPRERFYAISVEKRLKHPAVVAISESARKKLFI